jgi:ABC-type Fe3+-hydroxamate transport system substrate-binding protein
MKLSFSQTLVALSVLSLIACAGPKPGTPEFVEKKEEEQQKAATKTVEQTISKAPSWYTQPPVDINSIFQSATESSPDMQRSMDKAVMTAKSQLASKLGDRVSQKIRDFATETGTINDEQVVRTIDTTRQSVATDINVAGYVLDKSEVVQEGNRYRSYVLLRYPLGENNKVIVAQVRKNAVLDAKVKASKAFEDLEKEIEAAKKK